MLKILLRKSLFKSQIVLNLIVDFTFVFLPVNMRVLILIIFSLFRVSANAQVVGSVEYKSSFSYFLKVSVFSKNGDSMSFFRNLPYPVYRFVQADVNGDGIDEFLIGSVRITILDSVVRKRVNIWKLENNRIVPMWLGSKMPHPVFDFSVVKEFNKCYVRTIELESNDLFLVADYEWHSFGLKFVRYLQRGLTLDNACQYLPNL